MKCRRAGDTVPTGAAVRARDDIAPQVMTTNLSTRRARIEKMQSGESQAAVRQFERWPTVLALLTALAAVNEDEIDWEPHPGEGRPTLDPRVSVRKEGPRQYRCGGIAGVSWPRIGL